MTTNSPHQHSAKIYQFPVGGRASVGPRGHQAKRSDPHAPKVTPTVAGEGWYHDAAIQEDKRTYEH
jgi:hypothetical protein